MTLPLEDVAERRQCLNNEAYFSVLKAFLATGQSQMSLVMKLRKELNISNAQHRQWLEELKAAQSAGQLAYIQVPRDPGRQVVAQAQAMIAQQYAAATAMQQQQAAAQQRAVAGAVPKKEEEEPVAEMVGYKVNYWWESNRTWQEGIITRYLPPNILITFNIGTKDELNEWVKWEQSPRLQMLPQRVDLAVLKQRRAQ